MRIALSCLCFNAWSLWLELFRLGGVPVLEKVRPCWKRCGLVVGGVALLEELYCLVWV